MAVSGGGKFSSFLFHLKKFKIRWRVNEIKLGDGQEAQVIKILRGYSLGVEVSIVQKFWIKFNKNGRGSKRVNQIFSKIAILVKAPALGKNYFEGWLSACPSIIFLIPSSGPSSIRRAEWESSPRALKFTQFLLSRITQNVKDLGGEGFSQPFELRTGPRGD